MLRDVGLGKAGERGEIDDPTVTAGELLDQGRGEARIGEAAEQGGRDVRGLGHGHNWTDYC